MLVSAHSKHRHLGFSCYLQALTIKTPKAEVWRCLSVFSQRMWHFHCPVKQQHAAWPGMTRHPSTSLYPHCAPSHPLICLIDGPGMASLGNWRWHQSSNSLPRQPLLHGYRNKTKIMHMEKTVRPVEGKSLRKSPVFSEERVFCQWDDKWSTTMEQRDSIMMTGTGCAVRSD